MNQRYSQTANAALEAYRYNVNQIQTRAQQETEAASQSATEVAREGAAGRASAAVSAGARGVSGNTAESLIHEFSALEAENAGTVSSNLKMRLGSLGDQLVAQRAEAQSRIAGAAPTPVQAPSSLALAISLGAAGIGAARDYYTYRNMRI